MADEQVRAGVEYLAVETLRYWETQAKGRRITTPSPAAVTWQWAGHEVAIPAGPSQVLTAGVVTHLREQLYERPDEQTRLVILGGPGAGKTGAMLLLLLDVLRHRPVGSAQPVPVWLTLGGWNPHTISLQDWAVTILTRDYPGLAACGDSGIAGELIRTRRVALFLDGLDEMPPAVQGHALQMIDRDGAGVRLVLTSRPDEYRSALEQGRLWGAAVVDLLPVDLQHAEEFLLAEQLDPARQAWQHVIEHIRAHPDSVPARSLTTPLTLSLARDTYTRADPAELLDTRAHPTPEALLQHLLARFLNLAYPDPTERQHALRWLAWIAHHMGTSRDLRWWDISTWLPRRPWQRQLLNLTGQRIREPQTLVVRLPNRRETRDLFRSLRPRLRPWLSPTFMDELLRLWSRPMANAHTATPIEVYRSDRRQSYLVGFTGGLSVGLITGPMFGLVAQYGLGVTTDGLVIGFTIGLVTGLVSGFAGWPPLRPGIAQQLIAAEGMLLLRGQQVRFLPLLQDALDKQVLRQAGSVYQFRHAALQDVLTNSHMVESTMRNSLDLPGVSESASS